MSTETASNQSDTIEVQIVGGGRIGAALLGGVLAGGRAPGTVAVVEPSAERRAELAEGFPGVVLLEAPVAAAGTVLAVKPHLIEPVATAVVAAGSRRLLSVAAGVTLERLRAAAGNGVAVFRAMPNTPALIGEGMSALAVSPEDDPADLDWAEGILASVGEVVRVDEPAMDLVTGISGSGPAYVFLIAEALIDAGVLVGLPRDLATRLATRTLAGAAALMEATGEHPAELRAQVTSPGGTTARATRVLEERAVRAAIIDAVEACVERARDLGRA